MLYLEDYLEVIEHLPQELRDRFTDLRTRDLQVRNSTELLRENVASFFVNAKKLKTDQKQCEYDKIIKEYDSTMKYAEDKVQIADQMHDIMVVLIQRLDVELEKFKLELEADHAGITEELEKRSLELDRLNNELSNNNHDSKSAVRDRRRSEFRNRHMNSNNGYSVNSVGRPRLPHKKRQQQYVIRDSSGCGSADQFFRENFGRTSNGLVSSSSSSAHFGDSGFKNYNHDSLDHRSKGSNFEHQHHSALSAALASTPSIQFNSPSAYAMMNQTSQNKVSSSHMNNSLDSNLSLADLQQNPLAAAASQAIVATQQMQHGRRTSSLKASFAVINGSGMHNIGSSDSMSKTDDMMLGINRNALSTMAHDYMCNNGLKPTNQLKHGGNMNSNSTNPLYISVSKSGRPSKRPRHHASHLDESPTSISSNNSMFENSESLSSADFIESNTTFNPSSPSTFDFAANSQTNSFYQRDDTKYCICRQISYGEMVACDNDECEYEWFHYDCVGITAPPKGEWFCNPCLKKMAGQQNNNQPKKKGRKEKVTTDVAAGLTIKPK